MSESIPRPDPVPECSLLGSCGQSAVGEWHAAGGVVAPRCLAHAPFDGENPDAWHSYLGEPPRCALCRGLLWHTADGAWFCTSVACDGYRRPVVGAGGVLLIQAAPLVLVGESAGVGGEAPSEPARCTRAVCPWHPRDWPMCPLPEGHSEPCDPGPGPHPWVPAAEVEAARAEAYLAGRKFEHAVLGDLLRKAIVKENDDRTYYEHEAARLEAQAKSARDCALASHFRADGLAVMLDRVEDLP